MRDTKLLFDLAVSVTDADCAGGVQGRKARLQELCANGALMPALQFLQTIADSYKVEKLSKTNQAALETAGSLFQGFDAGSSAGTASMHSSGTSAFAAAMAGKGSAGLAPAAGDRASATQDDLILAEIEGSSTSSSSYRALSASMSNILSLFSSSDSADPVTKRATQAEEEGNRRAPVKHAPLTLVGSRSTAAVPWEALLNRSDAVVVRQLALIALCAQAFLPRFDNENTAVALASGVTGPVWV
jgi:hypothetical protein